MSNRMKGVVMAAVALAVSVTAFPLIFTGTAGITGYAQIATFTGLSSIAALIPLTSLVFMIFNSGWMTMNAIKGKGGVSNIMLAIAAPLVLFVGLLLLSAVILPGLYTLYTTDNGTYTGFQSICQIIPLPLVTALAFGSGYMAWKSGRSGGGRRRRYH